MNNHEAIRKVEERLVLRERQLNNLFAIEKTIDEGPCFDDKLDREITVLLIKTIGLNRYRRRYINKLNNRYSLN